MAKKKTHFRLIYYNRIITRFDNKFKFDKLKSNKHMPMKKTKIGDDHMF